MSSKTLFRGSVSVVPITTCPTCGTAAASKLSKPPIEAFQDSLEPGGKLEVVAALRKCDPEPAGRPESTAAREQQLLAIDAAPATPVIGDLVGQRVGGYRVLERINQGGMGEVFRVEHEVLKTPAALKVLLPEVAASADALDRFIQEARTSSEIGSPHIPRCYDFGFLADKRAYVLMELVEGESAASMIARCGPLPVAEVKQILREATEAFALAHARGIIHRDIKPEHLIVERRGSATNIKILDFGIAKVFSSDAAATQAGSFMGTALYCAPEQVLGEPVDDASDVYALGATAYEMLTGQQPYMGEAGHVLGLKTLRDPIAMAQLRPELPHAVVSTIERMMARDRGQRLATMRAAASEIAAWPEHPVSEPTPIEVRASRAGWWIAGATTACIVLAVAITLWPSSSQPRRTRAPEAGGAIVTPTSVAEPAPVAEPGLAASAAPAPSAPAPAAKLDGNRPRVRASTETRKPAALEPSKSRRPHRDKRSPLSSPASPKSHDVLIVDPWR